MATVVSTVEILNRFKALGWDNVNLSEVTDFLTAQAIPAAALIAYLNTAVSSPAGFDDQTITGCTSAQATKITNALKSKGVEAA
jgi:quinolinate synthase